MVATNSWQTVVVSQPFSSDDDDGTIGVNPKVSLDLERIREMTVQDPIAGEDEEDKVVADDVVRVTTSNWRPSDYRYGDNQFRGAISATESVVEEEGLHPTLQVGAEHLQDHRERLKTMNLSQISHISAEGDGIDRRQEHRLALRQLVQDG